VLKLSELCRKFETEQEKIIPFYVPPQVSFPLLDLVPGLGCVP